MSDGSAQEQRLVQFLTAQGYTDVIHGEAQVKTLLGLPADCKCADVIGFTGSRLTGGGRIIIAESKGTHIAHALIQLGNAAAGVFQKYHATRIELRLLVYVARLKTLAAGVSPGPGFFVGSSTGPTRELLDATTETSFGATARAELGAPWDSWNTELTKIGVEVYSEL